MRQMRNLNAVWFDIIVLEKLTYNEWINKIDETVVKLLKTDSNET